MRVFESKKKKGEESRRLTRTSSTEDFSTFRLIRLVLDEHAREHVSDAGGDVNHRTFFAEVQARRDRESESNGFGEKRPTAEVAVNDEA